MVKNAKRYIQFPLYSFPAGIINAIALQLPVFMLSAIYGLSVVGMYTFAYSHLGITQFSHFSINAAGILCRSIKHDAGKLQRN